MKRVYAHPQALMQSSDFLNQHDWQQLSMENNAVAAQKVRDEKDPSQAAVAGEVAGEIYGLKKLAGPINNCPDNTTRFLILAKDRVYQAGAEKISLLLRAAAPRGTLYSMLGNFIFNDVNMRDDRVPPDPGGELAVPLLRGHRGKPGGCWCAECTVRNHARSEKCKNIRKLLDSLA